MKDSLLRQLANLPAAEPDARRTERIRVRCHARLAQRPRSVRPVRRPRGLARVWRPLAAGLGGVYLTEVIRQVLRLYGIV
jgi:hypothetical protein